MGKEKKKPQTGRKHLQIICLIMYLYAEYIKNSPISTRKQTKKLKVGKRFGNTFYQRRNRQANKHMKK